MCCSPWGGKESDTTYHLNNIISPLTMCQDKAGVPSLALAKSPDLVARSWVQMLAFLLSGCGSLGQLGVLFVPQFAHL